MKGIIIYGSKYGTAKQYAIELSKRINIKAFRYEEIKDISEYDTIIYLGGLYAGGVLGLSNTMKLLSANSGQRIIIATVGLSDPNNKSNTDNIKASMSKQVPQNIYNKADIFHLRGGIDYKNLNFKDKILMKLLYTKVKNIPIEEQTAEEKEMIETYNKKVDFIDFNSLNKIIEVLH